MHYCVIVITDERNPSTDAVAALMEPHREDENCNGHWDWYQIGGRWTGKFDGFVPADDPSYYETCKICGGTGMRNDQADREHRLMHPEYTCNGCNGTGKSLKWPTQYPSHPEDFRRVANIWHISTPYSFVTPDGEWHEKESWNGDTFIANEPYDDEWDAAKTQYADMFCAVVDIHN